MDQSLRYRRWQALAIAVLSCNAATGRGQDVVEEILVTAQKREQSLRNVPANVSIVSGDTIEREEIRDMVDVAEQVPALSVTENTGPINTSFRLRRIGNEANIPNFEPSVGLFVDGVLRTRSGIGAGDLHDVERIEVVHGPQSTLYGKNTTAGVINVITRRPSDDFELFGEIGLGQIEGARTADLFRAAGVANAVISDKLRTRISASILDHGPTMQNLFVPDDGDDMSRYSLRAQLLYEPSTALSVRTILERSVIDSAHTREFEKDEGIAIAAINSAFGVPCPSGSSTDRRFCNNRAAITDLASRYTTIEIAYERAGFTLTSLSGYEAYDNYFDLDADQLDVDAVDFLDRQRSSTYSQEVRITSRPGEVEWLSGAYLLRSTYERGDVAAPTFVLGSAAPFLELRPGLALGEPGDSATPVSRTTTRHLSSFADVTWHAAERTTLVVGARWLTERKMSRIANVADHARPTVITLVLAPAWASDQLTRRTAGASWRVAVQHDWSDALTSFLSVSRGLKSGGFNAGFSVGPGAIREFSDETVLNHEAGLKASLLNGRLRLNASVYSAEYDDYQSAGFVSLRYQVNNAERVSVSGIDLDLAVRFGEHFEGGLHASYADATFDSYTGGSCSYDRLPDNSDGTACVFTGATLPFAPPWKVSAHFGFTRAVSVGKLYLRISHAWTDAYRTNQTLDARHVQPAYGQTRLEAGLDIGRLGLSIWAKNLRDTTYVLQDGPTNLFPRDPAFVRFLGPPRSYGLTLRSHW